MVISVYFEGKFHRTLTHCHANFKPQLSKEFTYVSQFAIHVSLLGKYNQDIFYEWYTCCESRFSITSVMKFYEKRPHELFTAIIIFFLIALISVPYTYIFCWTFVNHISKWFWERTPFQKVVALSNFYASMWSNFINKSLLSPILQCKLKENKSP